MSEPAADPVRAVLVAGMSVGAQRELRARLDTELFEQHFRSLRVPADARFALIHTGGAVVAAHPQAPDTALIRAVLDRHATIQPAGNFDWTEDGAGTRMVAYRQLRDAPLVVVFMRSESVVLSHLRNDVLWWASTLAACIAGAALLLYLMLRQMRRLASAEHAERTRERRFRGTVANLAEGVVLAERDGRVWEANAAALRMLALTVEQLAGTEPLPQHWEAIDEAGHRLPVGARPVDLLLDRGKSRRNWVIGIRAPGRADCWLSVNTGSISPDDGIGMDGQIASLSDITAVRAAHGQIQAISEAVNCTVGKSFFDELVRQVAQVLRVDIALVARVRGAPREMAEAIAVHGPSGPLPAFDYALAGSPCEHALDGGSCSYASGVAQAFPADKALAERGIEGYVGIPLRRTDGSPIGILVALSRTPLAHADQTRHTLAIFAARAEQELVRAEAEERLAASEALFRGLFEQAAVGINQKDGDGRCLRVNDRYCEITGYSREELLAGVDPTHPDDLGGQSQRRLALIADTIHQSQGVKRYRRKSGETIWVEFTSALILNENGEPTHMSVVQDITARHDAEESLQRLNQELEQRVAERTHDLELANHDLASFTHTAAHDLRAPLRTIVGFASLLRENFAANLPPEAAAHLERIRDGGTRMNRFIDSLLAFARLGRAALRKQEVDLDACLRDTLALIEGERAQRNVEIVMQPLGRAFADPDLVRHVLLNLLTNALKFSRDRDPARIEISARTSGNTTVYCVADNGVGFDMRHAEGLFEEFRRLHSSRDFEGSGVGLATVARIVERHGGRIWVDAEPDRGARFHFTLQPDAAAKPADQDPPARRYGT